MTQQEIDDLMTEVLGHTETIDPPDITVPWQCDCGECCSATEAYSCDEFCEYVVHCSSCGDHWVTWYNR